MAFITRISLLEGIEFRDNDAWSRFYDQYAPLIRLHGRDCGIPPGWDEDLIQDVSMAVLSVAEQKHWQEKQCSFRNYLRGIIRNKAYALLRAHYRFNRQIEPETERSVMELDQLWEEEWRAYTRRRALSLLRKSVSAKQFQIFELMNLYGWRGLRVALFLGMPLTTVYSTNFRMREKLQQILRDIDV